MITAIINNKKINFDRRFWEGYETERENYNTPITPYCE